MSDEELLLLAVTASAAMISLIAASVSRKKKNVLNAIGCDRFFQRCNQNGAYDTLMAELR